MCLPCMFRCVPGEGSSSLVSATVSHYYPVPNPLVAIPSVLCVGAHSRIRKSAQVG
jgi:hypothetical protein